MMAQTELVTAVSRRTGVPPAEVRKVLLATFRTIAETCAAGQDVKWRGFGAFRTKIRPERPARNPRTGEAVIAPSRRIVMFRPGDWFRQPGTS